MAKRRVSLKAIEASIKSPRTPGPMKAGLIRKYGKQLGLTKAQIAKYTKASGAVKKTARKVKEKRFTKGKIHKSWVEGYAKEFQPYFPRYTAASLKEVIALLNNKSLRINLNNLSLYMKAKSSGGKGYGVLRVGKKKNPSRKRSNPSLTSDEMYELQELYHTARAAGMNTKYDRMKWAAAEFHKVHPDIPAVRAYKALSAEVGFLYRNPRDKGRGKYKRTRLESPKHFDPRSFRTKTIKKGTKVVIGCPKGKYVPRKGACKVGTRAQALLKAKRNPKSSFEHMTDSDLQRLAHAASLKFGWYHVYGKNNKKMEMKHLVTYLASGNPAVLRFANQWAKENMKHSNPPRSSATPTGGVVIYDNLQAIEAQKGNNSLWPKENFRHDFKGASKAKVIGMPDGSLVIKGKKRLWNNFQYSEEDGTRGKRRNPVKKNPRKTSLKWYIGENKEKSADGSRVFTVFGLKKEPTRASHGKRFRQVAGPFDTKAAAIRSYAKFSRRKK